MTNINLRPILWIALGLALFLNVRMWQRDYAPPAPVAGAAAAPNVGLDATAPVVEAREAPNDAAQTDAPPTAAEPVPTTGGPTAQTTQATPAAKTLNVRTDVLDVDISLRGGELQRADLLEYPVRKEDPNTPVRVLRNEGGDRTYLLQSGLAGPADAERPTHLSLWQSSFDNFVMQPGQETLRVPLAWTGPDGVTVTKTYVFTRGSYRIGLEYEIQNMSGAPWNAAPYVQIRHEMPPVERSYFNVTTYAFEGPALHDGTKYRKLEIDDDEDTRLDQEITGGWVAGLQHHFTTAIVPPLDQPYRYTLRARGHEYVAMTMGPTVAVPAGGTTTLNETLWIGPKLQTPLDEIHPELDRVADYGMLWILAKPLFWLLEKAHAFSGNWGIAIILVTFLLKLVFYPLSEASGKSMAKMKTLGPRMKSLQETYKDDREKLGRAMMDLYKREKVNPAAGCLPLLIQFPVFIAFYWVLLESVEMRQAPFFGWIQDLSSRDPFFVLPLIMAGAMFLQYKLNPTPADPVQQKVFMILPIVMSVTFAFFPAGLVLYWVTNTVLSIAQQWNINRRIEATSAARR